MTNAELFDYIALAPESGRARHLVVLLHGYGFDAGVMQSLARTIAEKLPDARIIMPHAPQFLDIPADESGNALKVPQQLRGDTPAQGTQREWFTIRGDEAALRRHALARAGEMNRFIDAHRDADGLGNRDIALMGFSQGGCVALVTAFTRANRMGCAVGHSTLVLPDPALRRNDVPTLFLYGDADEEFSQNRYRQMAQGLAQYTNDLETHVVPGLPHKTSRQSRDMVAAFIARKMGGSAPSPY